MSSTRSTSPRQFADYLEDHPASLRVWNVGEDGLYPFLAWLEVHTIAEQRDRAASDGPHVASLLLTRSHHNQVGLCVAWALTYLPGRKREGQVEEPDLLAAFELAGRYWRLKSVMAEVRQGVRSFSAKGRKVRIGYRGDAMLDATDRLLDLFEEIMKLPEGAPVGSEALRSWVSAKGWRIPWEGLPIEIKEEYRHFAGEALARQPTDLPADFDVGGFTIAEATRVLHELLAQAWHSNACLFMGSTDPLVIIPPRSRSSVVGQLARDARVPAGRVDRIVDLLTADLTACPDPCLTPLVPFPDQMLVAMSSLIAPGALVRNLTARLQADPARFGAAGRRLGLIGSQTVAATLRERLTGAHIDERINVFDASGIQVGDLDVVVFDPATSEVVVFEVLWGIGPDGSAEVAKTEARAHDKREQVRRLRAAVEEGSRIDWPRNWHVSEDATYRWFILTPNVLPTLPLDDDGISIRSHQMLKGFRWSGTTVADMVYALTNPPPPPEGFGTTYWASMRYGRYDLQIESLVG